MFGIGDFARHGRVSVRMLRHYDALGLLRPAHVDPATGYRYYQADQFARLNRIIALRELGFTLRQIGALFDERGGEPVGAGRLRDMLELRRAEVRAQIGAEEARLRRVEAKLRLIESEVHVHTQEVVLKNVPATRVAELSAVAASFSPEDIGTVIQPLYRDLLDRMEKAGVATAGPGIAVYTDVEGGVLVRATVVVCAEPGGYAGFAVTDLPPLEQAAAIVHHGSMEEILPAAQALAAWIEGNGYRSLGYPREVNLECPPEDHSKWVTELQIPVSRGGATPGRWAERVL